ncbi:DNA polymerase III subunit gamma/tau [Terrimonas rubra]|uniref:DNA polymerase III subunit gamma/tau n=1 Tax=Terrimonas rubra TaxID=1035890 RepID=A0ABW6A4V2_9BACT
MEKFIVSARKYRPQLFNTVVGQSHITTTLKNAIKNDQLAHAFLFCGPRGVGKTTCARILAKTINCEDRTADGEACNKCNSCVSFNEGTSMNIHELDAASNNSVDDIRALVEQVRFAPQAGRYKVYIIDEVHMLSASAFNAFLKTLEEPPSYAIFILATTEKHKILPTILSRCQIFDFKRITNNDTVEHLQEICEKEEVTADKAALQVIAQKSEGCMRDALSIMDKIVSFTGGELNYANTLEHLNILDADYYFKVLECMLQQDLAGAMLLYDDINRKGFEGDMVLNGMAEFIRNLLVCKDERAAALLEAVENHKSRYLEKAKEVSAAVLISALNILTETEISFKAARNKRLHVEMALIKLCYLQQAMQLTTADDGVSKKKIVETTRPVGFRQLRMLEHKPKAIAPAVTPVKETLPAPTNTMVAREPEARLTITETKPQPPARQPVATPQPASATKPLGGGSKLSALEKIRNQYKNAEENKRENKPLHMETLQAAWNEFAQILKDEKNAAGQNFEMSELVITGPDSFYAKAGNTIQYRFIESNSRRATEFLKEKLDNAKIEFIITKIENQEILVGGDAPLSSSEQFIKMVEMYPVIKELKDKLKLDLDY